MEQPEDDSEAMHDTSMVPAWYSDTASQSYGPIYKCQMAVRWVSDGCQMDVRYTARQSYGPIYPTGPSTLHCI